MTRKLLSKAAQKNHTALVAGLDLTSQNGGHSGAVHLCDAGEEAPRRRHNDRLLVLEQGDGPALVQPGPGLVTLRYHAGSIAAARPALIAAMAMPGEPIAADPATRALLVLAQRVAASDIPVLVQGPTGTGKEVLARFLHDHSARAEGPFVALNCAAMPEAMLESMLFGHRKGAFTGASEAHEGFFRAADGGTLLLDEIGEMPLGLQAKLLRALQEGEVTPIGSTSPVKVDVRIVACTNRDLTSEIVAGRFREDLFYRLNVFPLTLPALRERQGDLAALAFGMLLRHRAGGAGPSWIANDALAKLASHAWPGNVRELENVMRRALLLAGEAQHIDAGHIQFDAAVSAISFGSVRQSDTGEAAQPAVAAREDGSLADITFRSESGAILKMLDECGGRRRETARRLGISERTLRYRLANMRDAGLQVAGASR